MRSLEAPVGSRSTAARLARLHLRTGARALARAELETMAGRGELDTEALADLAEVRWRTGDMSGAGEAAEAHLREGGSEPIAHVIIVEALAAAGRTREARQQAARFMAAGRIGEAELAAVFAGGPRPAAWPAPPAHEPGDTSTATGATAGTDAAEAAIWRGDALEAAARLGATLRSEPALAPLVLSLAEEALAICDERGPTAALLQLVRGDAFRLLGREHEAWAAFLRSRQALEGAVESEGRS